MQRSESLLTLDWARTRLRVAKTPEKTGLRRMHDLASGVTWADQSLGSCVVSLKQTSTGPSNSHLPWSGLQAKQAPAIRVAIIYCSCECSQLPPPRPASTRRRHAAV